MMAVDNSSSDKVIEQLELKIDGAISNINKLIEQISIYCEDDGCNGRRKAG